MSDSDARLHRIMRRLVHRSFPRLRRVPLSISWGAGDDEFLYYAFRSGHHVIGVDECLRDAPQHVLQGGIVHELCHIAADLRLGPYQQHLAWGRYRDSRFYRMREERATDFRVIQLGYGPELLAFIRFVHRLGFSSSREHGLSLGEVGRALEASSCSLREADAGRGHFTGTRTRQ